MPRANGFEASETERTARIMELRQLFRPVLASVRDDKGTEWVCSNCGGVLVPGYALCSGCRTLRSQARGLGLTLSDSVFPLSYALPDHQLFTDIYEYKRHNHPSLEAQQRLRALVWSFFYYHRDCLEADGRGPATAVATVPSGNPHKEGTHPLKGIEDILPDDIVRLDVVRTQLAAQRSLDIESLAFADVDISRRVMDKHAIVLDDTWASGAKAQSVAALLLRAGAAHVSIVTCARYVNGEFNFGEFAAAYGDPEWSVSHCPIDRRSHR